MGAYINGLLKKCNEYRDKYSSFTEMEKIDIDLIICNYLHKVMGGNNFSFCDEDIRIYFHDLIMDLENPHALIFLVHRVLNANLDISNRDVFVNGVNDNLVNLLRKKMDPFLNCGLAYQLGLGDRFLVKQYELGNNILNCNCKHNIRDMLHNVLFYEDCLKIEGIESNILDNLFKKFSVEQLAFVYAQLSSLDIGVGSSFDVDGREAIYKAMNNHSLDDKIDFIKTICLFGYCNNSEGISAMLMDMYKNNGSEVASRSLYSLMIGDNKWKYGMESDYCFTLLDYSNRANIIRVEEVSRGEKLDNINGYLNKAYRLFGYR